MDRRTFLEVALVALIFALWIGNLPRAFAQQVESVCIVGSDGRDYCMGDGTWDKAPLATELGEPAGAVNVCVGEECQKIPISDEIPFPTPPEWEDGEPPATATPETEYTCSTPNATVSASTKAACCSMLQAADTVGIGSSWTQLPGPPGFCQWNTGSGTANYGGVASNTGCPAGYTLVSGNCNLTDPEDVMQPEDGECGIRRSGNSFETNPNDPDCAPGAIPSVFVDVDGNMSIIHTGSGTKAEVELDSVSGWADIKISRPNRDGDTDYTQYQVSGSGGSNPYSVQGVGSGTNLGSGTGGSGEARDCPGCARESTQLRVEQILKDLRDKPTDTSGTSAALEAAANDRVGAIETLGESPSHGISLSFSPLWPSPSCDIPDFTVAGHTMDTSDWCNKISILRQLIGFALYVMTAMTLYSIFTRPGGA